MTHPRTSFSAKDRRPTIGQGFDTLTGTLVDEKPVTKESIEGESYDESAFEAYEFSREQVKTDKTSLSTRLGAHASFVLTVLGGFNKDEEINGESIESFLVMIMPLRKDTIDLPKFRATLPDSKVTPEIFISRSGDSYVKSITYGHYLLAGMISVKDEQKKERGRSVSLSATEPTTGIGAEIKSQASQERKLTFSTNQKFIVSSSSEFSITKEGGGYDRDKIIEKFSEYAADYRQAQNKKAHSLPAMTFEIKGYDENEDTADDSYITNLKVSRANVKDAICYTERYLEAIKSFHKTLDKLDIEGAKPEDIAQERKAVSASQLFLTTEKEKLESYQKTLEAYPSLAHLSKIKEKIRDSTILLIEKKEELQKITMKRLVGVVTLKSTEGKHDLSQDLVAKLKMLELKEQQIEHLYIVLEGNEDKETAVSVYQRRDLMPDVRCFTFQSNETFLNIRYLTAMEGLYFGTNKQKKKKHGQQQNIAIKIYAVHPYYDKTVALTITVEKTAYFQSIKLPAMLNRPETDAPTSERLARSEQRWRSALKAKRLTNLDKAKSVPHFVRRDEIETLNHGPRGVRESSVQVIHGMGGVGKTQLATDYAHNMREHFEFVRWVQADPQKLGSEWESLGRGLGLELKGLDEINQRCLVCEALSNEPSWLLVLDNLANEDALKGLLPKTLSAQQQVLITSRSEHWGSHVKTIPLTFFTPEKAKIYFNDRLIGQYENLRKGTEALAKELGYLPLALSHAVAYMMQCGIDGESYLKLYQDKGVKIFGEDFGGNNFKTESTEVGYQKTILTIWLLSMELLEKEKKEAAQLVRFCGYLHPDEIPEVILKGSLEFKDDEMLNECVRVIKKYALLSREAGGIKIHRLVQAAIRHQEEKLPPPEQYARHLRPLAETLSSLYPDFYHKTNEERALARRLEPHIQTVSAALRPLATSAELEDEEKQSAVTLLSHLLLMLGDIAKVSGSFMVSKQRCEEALKLLEKCYGEKHIKTRLAHVSLGDAELELGEYEKAKTHYLLALEIKEKQSDAKDKVSVALIHNQLGRIHERLGEDKQAFDDFKKAIECRKELKIDPSTDLDLAVIYNCLGAAHHTRGNIVEASKCYSDALKIRKKVYPNEDHPDLIRNYISLGVAQIVLGELVEAFEFLERARKIGLRIYGTTLQPDMAKIDHYLGVICLKRGQWSDALRYGESALASRKEIYGDKHPDVAWSYNQMGFAHRELKDPNNAIDCHKAALGIIEDMKPPSKRDKARCLSGLGMAHLALGQVDDAYKENKKALDIRLEFHGEKHPDVAMSHENLGHTYLKQGDLKKALDFYKNANEIYREIFGDNSPNHPDLAVSYKNLGSTYQKLGRIQDAINPYHEALKIYRHLGKENEVIEMESCIKAINDEIAASKIPDAKPQPASTSFSSYFGTFFRNHPGKAVLMIGSAVVGVGALAYYTSFKKPGRGSK